MSAKHGAKESAAWTRELGIILLDGIGDNRQGKEEAQERVKALHPLPQGKERYPKDLEKWLTKVFDKPSEDGVSPWLTLAFWQQEVDKVLIQGIFARNVTQDEVVQRIRSVWPKLSISWLGARMEEVARTGLPRWMDHAFWRPRSIRFCLVVSGMPAAVNAKRLRRSYMHFHNSTSD